MSQIADLARHIEKLDIEEAKVFIKFIKFSAGDEFLLASALSKRVSDFYEGEFRNVAAKLGERMAAHRNKWIFQILTGGQMTDFLKSEEDNYVSIINQIVDERRIIEFFVPGTPAPSGSKKGFYNPKLKRTFIVENNPDKMKDWRNAVRGRAFEVRPKELIKEPVFLRVKFTMPRLKSHFGSGAKSTFLKDSAPYFHKVKPDGLKLLRNTEDGLTGIILLDDSLVVRHFCEKVYGNPTGANIYIEILKDLPT